MSYSELPMVKGKDLLSLQADMAKVNALLAPAPPAARLGLLERLSKSLAEENISERDAEIRLMDCTEALEDLPASLMDLARIRAMKGRCFMPKPIELINSVRNEIDALLDAKHQIMRLIDRAESGV